MNPKLGWIFALFPHSGKTGWRVHGEFINHAATGIWNGRAMVPPSVVIKDGMGGRRLAGSFSWSTATERSRGRQDRSIPTRRADTFLTVLGDPIDPETA